MELYFAVSKFFKKFQTQSMAKKFAETLRIIMTLNLHCLYGGMVDKFKVRKKWGDNFYGLPHTLFINCHILNTIFLFVIFHMYLLIVSCP